MGRNGPVYEQERERDDRQGSNSAACRQKNSRIEHGMNRIDQLYCALVGALGGVLGKRYLRSQAVSDRRFLANKPAKTGFELQVRKF